MFNPTLSGLPRAIKRIVADGLLFIGDPQMSCVTPGRRLEEDFLPVTLNKLKQCREIAEENNLFVIMLGDLFENPTAFKARTKKVVENTNRMLAGYAQAMAFRPAVTVPGNHDKEEVSLTVGTTLDTLRSMGMIDVIEPSGPYAILEIQGKKIGLGGTPYGEAIPKDVRGLFNEPVDQVIWITHSQFQFDIVNPFLPEVFEIKGCNIVVNGHDHTTQKPRKAGQTQWFNPGNITRLSVDMVDHVPSSWEWNPSMPAGHLKQHVLDYAKVAFTLQGKQVTADNNAATAAAAQRSKSLFSKLLQSDTDEGCAAEMDRSASGDLLAEDLDRVLKSKQFSEGAKLTVRNLLMRAPERMKP